MWWIPPISSPVGLAIYYGRIYFLYDTCATFIYMPYYALTPELTQDYDERTSLTSIRIPWMLGANLQDELKAFSEAAPSVSASHAS